MSNDHPEAWTPPGREGDMFAPPDRSINITNSSPSYAPPGVVPTSGYATASLILGLATFLSGGITGPLAVIFGHLAMRETKTGARAGHGMTITGLILGYLSIAGWAIFILLLVVGAIGAGSTGVPS